MRLCRVSSVCCFMLSFMHSNKPTSRWTEIEVHREKRMRHSTLSRRSDFPVRSKPPSKMRERLCKEKGTNPLLLCQLVRVARRLSCLKLDALFRAMCNHLCLHLTLDQVIHNILRKIVLITGNIQVCPIVAKFKPEQKAPFLSARLRCSIRLTSRSAIEEHLQTC